MLQLRGLAASFALTAPILVARASADAITANDRCVENLAAFTRLYGYVRFFHLSDEANAIDWDAFAILGAETVSEARVPPCSVRFADFSRPSRRHCASMVRPPSWSTRCRLASSKTSGPWHGRTKASC